MFNFKLYRKIPFSMDAWLDAMPSSDPTHMKKAIARQLPSEFNFEEDTPGDVDLSSVNFNKLGKGSALFTITLNASTGTLDAASGSGVTVVGAGTDTLLLTGTLDEIGAYLNNTDSVVFTGDKDDFGDNASVISLTSWNGRKQLDLGEIEVDISDVCDPIMGTSRADTLIGDEGRNYIHGLGGNDSIEGGGGYNNIDAGAGDDTVSGGAGGDTLQGGSGIDTLYYVGSTEGVTIDLNEDSDGFQSASGGDAKRDVISGFENVYASHNDDTITGNDARNILFGYDGNDVMFGMAGDDVMRGGQGADTLDGGDGVDWLRYLGSEEGVTVDLTLDDQGHHSASGGDAEGDVLSGFENIQGSDHGDTLTGSADKNYILGFDGDDMIDGGASNDTIRGGEGADTLEGGAGADVLQYTGSSAGVTVDLTETASGLQTASGGDAEGDVISGFEHVYATNHDDNLTGDDGRNFLYGYDGEDSLNGGDGKDVLRGGADADSFVFDTTPDAGNYDRIIDFVSGEDTMVLDSAVFDGLARGTLDADLFVANAGGTAETVEHRVIYDTDSGMVYYDSDGSGDGESVAFAHLTSLPMIGADDFLIG